MQQRIFLIVPPLEQRDIVIFFFLLFAWHHNILDKSAFYFFVGSIKCRIQLQLSVQLHRFITAASAGTFVGCQTKRAWSPFVKGVQGFSQQETKFLLSYMTTIAHFNLLAISPFITASPLFYATDQSGHKSGPFGKSILSALMS